MGLLALLGTRHGEIVAIGPILLAAWQRRTHMFFYLSPSLPVACYSTLHSIDLLLPCTYFSS